MMDSSVLEILLVPFAQAIEVGDLKLADSLLGQIWNFAAENLDKRNGRFVKYIAEALVRQAYGIHSHFTLELTTPPLVWDSLVFDSVKDAIKNVVKGKKRLHLIDFYIPRFYREGYLYKALPYEGDVSVRVSLVLPRFLEKLVNVEEEKQYLIEQAKRYGVQFEYLKVVYADNLAEVDECKLGITDDEAVVVFYSFRLCKLVVGGKAIEGELKKLRHIIPEIVIMLEFDANYNDSNFVNRLGDRFQHLLGIIRYFQKFPDWDPVFEMSLRQLIANIVGCKVRDPIVRYQTIGQWRSLLSTADFLPLPLKLRPCDERFGLREDNGCLFGVGENHPLFFL